MHGQIALVTGGASGIGARLCARLVARGAIVWLCDVDDELAAAAAEIGATPMQLDVADRDAWDQAVATIHATHGRLDVVALNAGVGTRPKGVPLLDDPFPWTAERYEHVRGVNVDGVIYGVLATLGLLEAGGGGRIVVTASVAGLATQEPDPAYAMTKSAVIGWVRSVAAPLAERGISIGAVCPGGVDTSLVPPDLRDVGRNFAPPDHVAAALEEVLDKPAAETGGIWVTYRPDEPLWRYEFPSPRSGGPAAGRGHELPSHAHPVPHSAPDPGGSDATE